MNQCRSEMAEPSTMHFRCQLETGHDGEHHYFVPEDEDLVRKDRDALVLQIRELVEALQHMKSCGSCAEDSWNICEGGRAAQAALDRATSK